MARMIHCIKLNKQAEALDFAPLPNELGQKIFDNVSKQAWQMWLQHQTMLINEYRLNLADKKSRDFLAEEMEKYFFNGGSEKPEGYMPTNSNS